MKLLGVNNLTKPFPVEVSASLHGFKFDSIQLNQGDIDKLLALTPKQLHDYFERLNTKFRATE